MSIEVATPVTTPNEAMRTPLSIWISVTAAVAAVLALYSGSFASMVSIWNRDSTFTHGYFIPLLSVWLLWRKRDELKAQSIKPAPKLLPLLFATSVVWLLATFADIHVVEHATATLMLPVVLWVVLGHAWMRVAAFPLAYLLFAVPFGDFLVPSLVAFTTRFTVAAVKLIGVPIYQEGASFMLPSGTFEVVKACSGVRYLIATLALGTLFAALSYRSWKRFAIFMIICVVFPILANGVRAFGIVMIAHYSEMRYAVGFDHLIYGWLFFGVVIFFLFWIGSKFSDLDDVPSREMSVAAPRSTSAPVLVGLLLTLVAAPAFSMWWRRTAEADVATTAVPALPAITGWIGPAPAQSEWRPAFALGENAIGVRYAAEDAVVEVYSLTVALGSADSRLLSMPLVDDSQLGWRSESTGLRRLDSHRAFDSATVLGHSGARMRVWRWYIVNGADSATLVETKFLQLRSWMAHRRPEATVIAVVVPESVGEDGRSKADAVLARFVAVNDWQHWVGRR